MPCLEFNTIGKGVQYKCKYQKLRCYNGVKLAHCFTFFVFSFPEKLGGWTGCGGPRGRQGLPKLDSQCVWSRGNVLASFWNGNCTGDVPNAQVISQIMQKHTKKDGKKLNLHQNIHILNVWMYASVSNMIRNCENSGGDAKIT